MTNNVNQDVESIAQSLIEKSPHYADSVLAMADSHDLSASEDIVSSSGIKLVARGTKIDKHLREKLSSHRLSGSTLENSLEIADSVTQLSLANDIGRLIDEDPWFRQLAAKSGDPGAMRYDASRLVFPTEMLFRLTVAREQNPGLYQHSLCVAIIAHYLALRLDLKRALVDSVLIAALCHDLGELYTDPAILESGHRVSDEERRFIYVHPITGWLIIRDIAGLNADVAKAVIQHQERLDGSGYPFGIRADAIGLAGRILAVADVSASIMSRFRDHRRLSTLLRLNNTKYDRKVIDLIHDAIVAKESVTVAFEEGHLKMRLYAFAQLLDVWSSIRSSTDASASAPVVFLADRMYTLRTAVLSCGFDPDSLDVPLQMAEDDPEIRAELAAVVDELRFQLADLEHETDRRMSDWLAALEPIAAVAFNDWRKQLHECNHG